MQDHDLDRLDPVSLDALPDGVIELDRDGRITRYNLAEARRARITRWQVVGRDFVREVGWTVGPDAAARVRRFVDRTDADHDVLRAEVTLRGRTQGLELTMCRHDSGRVYLVVRPRDAA